MNNWLSNNVGALITAAVIIAGLIASWATNRARIENIEKSNQKCDDERKELQEQFRKIEDIMYKHQANTSVHVDPERDTKRWDDFKAEISRRFDHIDSRFDTTDRKIERIMIIQPPPTMT